MKSRNGITLLEIILALALFSIVIVSGTSLFAFGNRAQNKTLSEYEIQSNIRIISENVNSTIRDASGIFLLDKEYPSDDTLEAINGSGYFTDGWNYLMLNKDKTELIEWVWDGTKHIKKTIINSLYGLSYNLTYLKSNAANVDNLLNYELKINALGIEREIKSELEGLNTLQIVDRSYGGEANTISYRNDSRLDDIGVAQAAVSFVIDTSGSMSNSLGGKTRLSVLKIEANKMIDGLAENENVNLSITPFASNAYDNSSATFNTMFPIKVHKDTLEENINILKASGNTNTGDGMRRGYYAIKNFNELTINQDRATKNFMIILVDGESNRSGFIKEVNLGSSITFDNNPPPHSIVSGSKNYEFEKWEKGFLGITNNFYYKNGNNRITFNKPQPHEIDYDGVKYSYSSWDAGGFLGFGKATFTYKYEVEPYLEFVEDDGLESNISSSKYVNEYIKLIGKKIKGYRNTRDDDIEVFVIGFTNDATPSGLKEIAKATKATSGTEEFTAYDEDEKMNQIYRYYMADTAEALEVVLNEIKFQISEALWHIGGPN